MLYLQDIILTRIVLGNEDVYLQFFNILKTLF